MIKRKRKKAEALCNLGWDYYENKDTAKALECYLKAAKLNDVWATYAVGLIYAKYSPFDEEYDDEIEQDYSKAVYWYRKAAELGHKDAIKALGHMYFEGKGVEQSYDEAFKYYKASDAKYWLGVCYARSLGVERNEHKAIEYLIEYMGSEYNGLLTFEKICFNHETDPEDS